MFLAALVRLPRGVATPVGRIRADIPEQADVWGFCRNGKPVEVGHLGLWGVLFSGCLNLVWAPGSLSGVVRISHSVGQEHPGLWGVLLSECLDLVWSLGSLSGVV